MVENKRAGDEILAQVDQKLGNYGRYIIGALLVLMGFNGKDLMTDPIGSVRTEVAKLSAKFDKIDEIDKKMIDVNKLIDQVNVNTSKIHAIESQVVDLRNNKVDVKKPGIK